MPAQLWPPCYLKSARFRCMPPYRVPSQLPSSVHTPLLPHSSAHEPLNHNTSRSRRVDRTLLQTWCFSETLRVFTLRFYNTATFCLWILMTRQRLRGRLPALLPPPSLLPPSYSSSCVPTLAKLTENPRDQRFELTFTSPCLPPGPSVTCPRTITAVCSAGNKRR